MDLAVVDDRSRLLGRLEGDEAVAFVGPQALGLQGEQAVHDLAELREVLPELVCSAHQGAPGWGSRR